jgi:hypothetical protein
LKGLVLPAAFVEAVNTHTRGPEDDPWMLRDNHDAFGQPIELELDEVYQDMPSLIAANEDLAVGVEPNDAYGMRTAENIAVPGAIADIVDFEAIVCFGRARDGTPFCVDYCRTPAESSVICWDSSEVYWRPIAPDSATFVALLRPWEDET